ncbi:MAG: UDP-2,4-diacetamido-2,4,6-trideoxy-beta-L-altropyranose hydrolase [Pseudomonas sp. PGPPP3]|nr:MAG: UDP-2,4-diacetamido-2,4,6-trideoxy-beta-L-altropyranose hydrolase [Pseudomonas sp. PGPPP3]
MVGGHAGECVDMKCVQVVVIRVDASMTMGTGHVMRCLTLAEALRTQGVQCRFICREHPGHMIAAIRQRGFEVAELPEGSIDFRPVPAADVPLPAHASWLACDWLGDAEQTLRVAEAIKPDLLVIDHYAIDFRWENALRSVVPLIMAVDDLADRMHACDFLLDQNWFGVDVSLRYQGLIPGHCVPMLGPRYALLKPEYATLRAQMAPRDGEVRRVLVFMGGSDPTNETGKVIEALMHSDLRHLLVDVVVGANHSDLSGIVSMAKARPGTHVYSGLPSLAGLMMRADLMIGGGGSTTWERMCLGLPAVVICIAKNQIELNSALSRAGYLESLGSKDDVDTGRVSDTVRALIERRQMLSAMSEASLDLVRGDGANCVCETLLRASIHRRGYEAMRAPLCTDEVLKIRRASINDAEMLFEWRNDLRTRKYFRNAAPLSQSSHMSWFFQTLANERSELLISSHGECPVGCLRFDIDGERAEVSIYLDPSKHGQGLGTRSLHQAMEWMYSKHPLVTLFIADVIAENSASANLFQRCGYSRAWQRFEFRRAKQ